jgi:hypothetical protein
VQTGIEQRRENLVFGCSAMSGAKIERVIGVHAVSDGGDSVRLGPSVQRRK